MGQAGAAASTPPPQHGLYLISFGWGPLWEPGSRPRNAGSRQPGQQVLTRWGWGTGSRCDFLLMKFCSNTLIYRSYNPIIITVIIHGQRLGGSSSLPIVFPQINIFGGQRNSLLPTGGGLRAPACWRGWPSGRRGSHTILGRAEWLVSGARTGLSGT